MEPTLLSERLERLADRTAPPPRADLAEVVVGRHRARRRETAGILAVCAAVAAVVLLVPRLIDPSSGATPAPAAPVTTVPATDADVLGQPTRGSLARDTAFLQSVRGLPWTEGDEAASGVPDASPESRHVVFAGDVPGGRWALVAGQDADLGPAGDAVVAWFVGPPGAAAEQLVRAGVAAGTPPGDPVALSDAVTGTLVVVGAPGDAVEISRRPDVASDGTISRTWEPVEAPDGVAVAALSPAAVAYDEALRYRVTRGGAVVDAALPSGYLADDDGLSPPDVSISWLREPPTGWAPGTLLISTAYDVLSRTGLSPDEVAFEVLWAGQVPALDDPGVYLHLVTATLPSGATYTEARLGRQGAGGIVEGSWCGTQLRPAGPPPVEQTFAVRCDVPSEGDPMAVESSLVVVAPATAVRARALDADGRTLAEFVLTDGAAVVPAPEGAVAVQTLAADGVTLEERPLMGFVDWDQE
jgi:hypothetical protein